MEPDLQTDDGGDTEPPDDDEGFDIPDAPEGIGTADDDAEKEENFETMEVDLGVGGDDDIIAGFDGVETDEEDEEDDHGPSIAESQTSTIAEAIEDGMAEVAVVGLEGAERDRIRSEMLAVANKFKLGYFGEQVAQKYLKRDLDDIPPEYGLAAAMLAFAAVTLYKRPDGEQKVREAVETLRSRLGEEDVPSQTSEPTENDNE